MIYLWAFVIGGLFCVVAELLTDLTDLTPAHVLVLYVVLGVVLGGTGVYDGLIAFAGSGATVPIVGFGYNLARGAREAVDRSGLLGALSGGLEATAAGIAAAVVTALVLSVFFKAKEK